MAASQTYCPLPAAWDAAAELTAAAYGVPVAGIRAESRGRGPRPPTELREPKKVAIYLAAELSGCDLAALARHLGLHKDTVCSHVAWAREATVTDPRLDQLIGVLGSAATVRLELNGLLASAPAGSGVVPRAAARNRLQELQDFMEERFAEAGEALSDEPLTLIRPNRRSSDDHASVIAMTRKTRSAA